MAQPAPEACASRTGREATMLLPDAMPTDIGDVSLEEGDIITAHRPDGTCVGRLVWKQQAAALTVWGDDEVTDDVDGLVSGEAIHLQVYDASESTTYTSVEVELAQPSPVFRENAEYRVNGMYLVKALRITGSGDSSSPPGQQPAPSSSVIGEAGVVQVRQPNGARWHTVKLKGTYDEPVVFLQALTHNGWQPIIPRLRDVTATSFEFQLQEWAYLDGWHMTESVGYLVVEAGRHELDDGTIIEVGRHRTATKATSVRFAAPFKEAPVVLSQVQTVSDAKPVVVRTDAVEQDGFRMQLQTEEAISQHGAEQVGWLAVAPGTGRAGSQRFEAQVASVSTQWRSLNFAGTFEKAPIVLAAVQSKRGADPVNVRMDERKRTGLMVTIQEEQSQDQEVGHGMEEVGILALSPGVLTVPGADDERLAKASPEEQALAQEAVDVPDAFELNGNYPNPFNPSTTIRFALPEQAPVRLAVYDVVGREVAVLVDGVQPAGYHEVRFDASRLPSGVYLYRLEAGAFTETGKMMLVK